MTSPLDNGEPVPSASQQMEQGGLPNIVNPISRILLVLVSVSVPSVQAS